MKSLTRLLMSALAAVATYYFAFWMSGGMLPQNASFAISHVIGLLLAAGAGWFAWSRTLTGQGGLTSSVVYGALIVGAIGFCAGFFGPLIFTPDSNQGPLLGIFITGPAGVVTGALAGLIYGMRKRSGSPRQ